MIKTLGWGGNGVAIHYKYHASKDDVESRDIVVKLPLYQDGGDHLLVEERTTNVSLIPAEIDEGEANVIQESKKVSPLYPSDRSSRYRERVRQKGQRKAQQKARASQLSQPIRSRL